MFQSFKLITPHTSELAKFSIIDDEFENPIIIPAKNIWEAIVSIYQADAPRNMIAFFKWRMRTRNPSSLLSNSLQGELAECRMFAPEIMNSIEMQKYLILL